MRVWCVMLGVAGAACLASPEHTDPPGADSAPSAADARASCADPPPGGGPCDNLCSSCTEEICEMDCSTGPACGLVVVCPDGLDCRVDCTGKDRCISVTVNCPAEHGCSLVCDGEDACENLVMHCGAGPCEVKCAGHTTACANTQLICGPAECLATCDGATAPELTCGDACACDACGA